MSNLQAIKQRFGIIGNSPALDHALNTAVRVANTDLTVLIRGESGVGKDVFSKIIHKLSARKHNDIIPVNCGAIPQGTINSELFGHDRGAFTGATSDRKGYFETVDGGTIFLDEIGEMPLDTQAFLLRVLESGEYLRVGSSKVLRTDVRVVAATNVDLQERIKKGKFREDLYYRLNTVPIRVPALKERREDIYLLLRKFAVDFADKYRTSPIQLEQSARQLFEAYTWPGNIRELKNAVEQLSVLAEEKLIGPQELLGILPQLQRRNLPSIRSEQSQPEDLQEREILYKLLFEMKNDLNDLKSLVFELVKTNNLDMPEVGRFPQLEPPKIKAPAPQEHRYFEDNFYEPEEAQDLAAAPGNGHHGPIIIQPNEEPYHNMEVVEENLSLEEMEKSMIQKALKKHKDRRKDAAQELGISERTLYRKIKNYKL
ncbi:MAG: sigma-54 dependent transcriptional regulator [Bacteroidota bacterium]